MLESISAMTLQAGLLWPILVAVGIWWLGTSVILLLDGLPRWTHRVSLMAATSVAATAFAGLVLTRSEGTAAGAYIAFFCAISIWGWNELSFLTGRITGPRRSACPADCRGPRHVGHAVATVLYHELAIAACGVSIFAITWNATNTIGAWTYAVLWVMRISAKLNLFLGVPNLSEELLPPHLSYLERYFRRRRMNALLPISLAAGTVATVWFARWALAPDATPHDSVGYGLVSTLMALAVLEHWFFVIPIPSTALWQLGLRSHGARDAAQGRSVPRTEAAPRRSTAIPAAGVSAPTRSTGP